ncbi:MAG: hypothetical protein JKY46_02345 [Robiginitomaculum sp.]|nr:hypothetical protein [Robiginitomaculum sp.]
MNVKQSKNIWLRPVTYLYLSYGLWLTTTLLTFIISANLFYGFVFFISSALILYDFSNRKIDARVKLDNKINIKRAILLLHGFAWVSLLVFPYTLPAGAPLEAIEKLFERTN